MLKIYKVLLPVVIGMAGGDASNNNKAPIDWDNITLLDLYNPIRSLL